ncbi:CDP-glycerol glycerophosphotransferase family protein, partial [Calditrichota bacterium]
MTKAQFYFLRSLHTPGLLPIYRELQKRGDSEVAFCIPYDKYDDKLKVGFKEDEATVIHREPVNFVNDPSLFKSDVIFVADALAPVVQNAGKIVNVGHGLLSKGMFFTDRAYIERENLNDLLLVPGEWHKERILRSGRVHIPVEAVGYPKIDPIFNGEMQSRDQLCVMAGLDPAKKIVLYAPTYNIELSALPHLWTRIAELATSDRYLLIKLHGATMPEIVEPHKQLAMSHDNIRFIADADITPYLQLADVMVSDVSSAAWEFILLDKPIVFFDNPNTKQFPHYDPNDIEFAWRDVGLRANDLAGIEEAVQQSLTEPETLSPVRQAYIAQLGIPCDGKASERSVDATLELLRDGKPHEYKLRERCLIVSERGRNDQVADLLGHSADFQIVTRSELTQADLESADILVVTASRFKPFDRWLFRLINHLRCDVALEAVVPLTDSGEQFQDPTKILDDPNAKGLNGEKLDQYLKCTLTGQTVSLPSAASDDIVAIRLSEENRISFVEDFAGTLNQTLSQARLALDVYLELIEDEEGTIDERAENRIMQLAEFIRQDTILETHAEKEQRLAA